VFGDVHFGWLGNMLYFYDSNAKRHYIVEDPLLGQLNDAFVKDMGSQPPLKYPSPEKWHEILLILEK